jgi:hypothetical protein
MRNAAQPVNAQASTGARTTDVPLAPAPKTLTLSYPRNAKLVAGAEVEAMADGLPPHRKVSVIWGTVTGGWVVEDYYRFRGKKYTNSTTTLAHAEVDADGHVTTRFMIPEDYGGVHEMMLSDNGVTLAQGGVEVSQTFEIFPTEGPTGTLIELRVKGLGWRTMESTWVVNWDNRAIGWVSAADTRGTSVARFRATGPIGEHHIKVYTGYQGQGYLNHEQAPNAHLPRPDFVFRVTPGRAVTASYAEPYPRQPIPATDKMNERASLQISPTQGQVLTPAVLTGKGFPTNAPLTVVWGSQAGNRVSGNGFAPEENEIARLTVGVDGSLTIPLKIPDDLGGLHAISVKSGDTVLSQAYFVVETSVVSISPTSGPAGTPVTIHLKGVGWTDYDNIYVATYDNAYMGYACGFNSHGDVVVNFTAAGSLGVHLIDFYPSIYQGPEGGQQLYRLPQLTYANDHPGNHIPALRFAFEVTAPVRRLPDRDTNSGAATGRRPIT